MASRVTMESDDRSEHKEGFLCPMCMVDLRSFHNLQKHFEAKHSNEDKDIMNQIKGVFSKAKEKLFNKEEENVESLRFSTSMPARSPSRNELDAAFWEPQELGATKQLWDSFRAKRDARIDRTVVETNKIIIRLGKILQLPESVNSKRKEFERTVVPWVQDEDVPFCPTCGDKFNIARRRHHCRLCGAIMCAKCSMFLSAREAEDIIERNKRVNEGSPEHRKVHQPILPDFTEEEIDKICVRVCVECDKVLQRNLEKLNLHLESSLLVLLHTKMATSMDAAQIMTPEFQSMAESLNNGEEDYKLDVASEKRIRLMQAFEAVDVISKKIAVLSVDDEESPPSPGALRLQSAIRKSACNFLQENMLSLPSLPSAPKLLVLQARRRAEHEKRLRREREEAQRARDEQKRQQEIEKLRRERELAEQRRREGYQESVQYSSISASSNKEQPSNVAAIRDPGWSAETVRSKRKDSINSGAGNPFEVSGDESDESDDEKNGLGPLKEQISYVKESMKQARAAGLLSEAQSLEKNLKELQLEYKRLRTARAFRSSTSENVSFNPSSNEEMTGGLIGDADVLKHQIKYITKCINEAKLAGKTDEVTMLTENLNEITLIYKRTCQ